MLQAWRKQVQSSELCISNKVTAQRQLKERKKERKTDRQTWIIEYLAFSATNRFVTVITPLCPVRKYPFQLPKFRINQVLKYNTVEKITFLKVKVFSKATLLCFLPQGSCDKNM